MSSPASANITSVLKETRIFPPPAGVRRQGARQEPGRVRDALAAGQGRPRGLLGRAGRSRCTGSSRWDKVLDWNEPHRQVVRRRQAQRQLQLPRPPPRRAAQEQGRDHLGGRAGRHAASSRYQDLHREVCKFANVLKGLGIKKGDRVTIYMPMVPELAIAMLACARIGATHSVIFGGFSRRRRRRPQQRRQGQARHHRRRRLAARQGRAAQGERRCGAGQVADRREVHRLQSLQPARSTMKAGPRPLVARADGRRLAPTAPPSRSTASIRSTSSTPRGSTGKPKGVLHTTGRLPARHVADAQVGLRPQGGRHLLVHRRRRLGDGAQLHRLRPARQRRDRRDVRRGARTSRARTASGRSSRSTGSRSSTPRRPRSAPSSSGATSARRSTTCRACACWAPSASRSTPKRGCGITRSSAAAAARSSIPGGRPRPARS